MLPLLVYATKLKIITATYYYVGTSVSQTRTYEVFMRYNEKAALLLRNLLHKDNCGDYSDYDILAGDGPTATKTKIRALENMLVGTSRNAEQRIKEIKEQFSCINLQNGRILCEQPNEGNYKCWTDGFIIKQDNEIFRTLIEYLENTLH